jgi:hypothetical protein
MDSLKTEKTLSPVKQSTLPPSSETRTGSEDTMSKKEIETQFSALRLELAQSARRQEQLSTDLMQILASLGTQANPSSATPTPSTPIIPTSPPATHKNRAKVATPDDFDGERTKGRSFLNSCQVYIKLCPDHFIDEQARIAWALSYMKYGRAATLADRALQSEARTGRPFFQDWAAFEKVFRTNFCLRNEETVALSKLESTKYYQGQQSVDDYIDSFTALIEEAGYTDGRGIVMKFRRGLDRFIQDKVAEMGEGRPSNDEPEDWYAAARRFDENRTANLAFHSAVLTTNATIQPRSGFSIRMPAPNTSTTTRPPPPAAKTVSDAAKTRFDAPGTCRRCGKLGHFVRECPMSHDVRFMTSEELDEWVQQRNVEKDVAITKAREMEQEEVKSEEEDFAPRSE